jgi:hypothetical protein
MPPTHRPDNARHSHDENNGISKFEIRNPKAEILKGASAKLAGVLDVRLLLTLIVIALVAAILTVTARMQEPRSGKQDATPAERVSLKNITRPVDKSAEKSEEPATQSLPSAPEVASNYTFTTATNASLTDMSAGTTTLVVADSDDVASSVTTIGFDFYFQGVRYAQFSANSNGLIRLGSTVVQGGSPYKPLAQASIPLITPYGADQRTLASTGKVHFKVTGSAPNRVLIVEWLNMQSNFNSGGTSDLTYQARLYETTGIIEFVYGKASMSTAGAADINSKDPNVGFSSDSTAGNVGSVTAAQSGTPAPTYNGASATPAANTYTAGTITVLDSATQGSRRIFTFTPPTPTAPTNLTFTAVTPSSMTLNWTDSANETIYAIYNSTDGTNFNFIVNPAQNATSQNVTGLNPSTTYTWRVFAVSEGAQSTALSGTQATAAPGNISSTPAGGNWSATTTWVGGVVPTSTDNVTITDGATVTIDTVATANAFSLSVGTGLVAPTTLIYNATVARTLTVGTNVTIASNGTFSSAATGAITAHVLSVGGNLTNNGVLDFSTSANTAAAGITFTGAANTTFGGTGATTDIRTITINKGASSTSVLELNPTNFTVQGVTTNVAGFLTLTNGTFKISGTFTVANRIFTTTAYTIPATTGIWLNNPNFTVSGQGASPTNAGLLRLTQGTYNIGTGSGNSMDGSAGAVFIIEGGTLNTTGRFSPQSAVSYTQSAGTVNVCTVGQSSNSFGSFELFSTSSSFTMSGGTINLVQASTAATTPIDFDVLSSTVNYSGGTLNIGTAATATNFNFRINGNTPAIVIDNTTNNKTATIRAQTVVFGSTTVSTGTTLNLNGFLFAQIGNLTNNGTVSGNTTGSRLYFAGSTAQTYSGTGVAGTVALPLQAIDFDALNGVTISPSTTNNLITNIIRIFTGNVTNSNKLTLGIGGSSTGTVQVGNTTTPTNAGSFDVQPTFNLGTGGEVISYLRTTNARTTGNEINPTRTLFSMSYDDNDATHALTIAGGDLTLSTTAAALTLTTGRVITNSNNLILSSGTATVTRTSGYVDGNLRKTFAATGTKTFEVGTANGYSPVDVNSTAGTFPANFTAKATQGAAPYVSGVNKLARYWTLTSPGVLTANLTFTYLATDVTGTVANYKFIKNSSGTLSTLNPTGTPTTTSAVINGVSSFSDWTLAEATAVQPGSLQFSSPTFSVSESGPTASVTVSRTGGTDGIVGVSYTTNSGTATAGSDFTTTASTLSWGSGDSATKTITIPITDDSLYENNEDFTVTLSAPTGGAVLGSQSTATVSINDNDTAPTISIGNASLTEGGGSMSFTVSQSAVSGLTTTFQYSTADVSATAGSDYTGATGASGSITAGNNSTTILIPITDDSVYEGNETFTVTLSNPVNATIATGTGTGTINDDDTAPAFSITPTVTHNEGNSGTTAFDFVVTKTGSTALSATVRVDTADVSATAPGDYTAITSQVLTFNPADTTQTVTVLVNGDTTFEPTETFTVTLSNPTNATIASGQGTGTGTITNDDVNDVVFNSGSNNLAGGTYHDVTINGGCPSSTYVTLTGNVIITGTFTINDCGNLYTNGFTVSGGGSFALNTNGWLHITDPNGITTSPALSGNIQTTGGRAFSSAANYDYDGSVNQAVGNGLPATVNDLLISNTGAVNNNTVTGNLAGQSAQLLEVISGVYSSHSDYVDVDIQAAGTLSLAGAVTVSGNWTNAGTFISNGFGVTFNGSAAQSISGSSATPFAALTISNTGNVVTLNQNASDTSLSITSGTFNQAGTSDLTSGAVTVASGTTWSNLAQGDLTLTGDVANAGTINFNANGGSCGDNDDIVISSSVSGIPRTWSGAGTFSMIDVNVSDQKTPLVPPPAAILVTSGTNAGGNTGWFFSGTCTAGTYTWSGGINADWQVPTNWSPTRTLPAAGDILIFDGNATPGPIVNNVPTETDAALRLTNGVFGVTLNAATAPPGQKTLTISGGTANDLSVPSGTLLTLAGSTGLTISLTGANTSTVGGLVIFQDGPHRLIGANAGEIHFNSGSIFTTTTGFTGNPFGSGTNGSVVFDSGSSAFFNAGNDPFGGDPSAITQFVSGSSQTLAIASAFSSNARTYGNLTLSGSQSYLAAGANANTVANNLTINSGSSLTLSNTAGGNLNLGGNWTNSGTFTPNSRTVNFNGATGQTIAGNTTFAKLTKSVVGAQTFLFTAGSLTTVTDALTLSGAAGQLLSLRSTTPGSQWLLHAPATQSVNFVDAQDSNANGSATVHAFNSTDSGNNLNWTFGPAPIVYVDPTFTGAPGTDPPGPATSIGYDAFATIQAGINGVATGGQVIVAAATYVENPSVTRAMAIKGAQFGVDARGRVASESIVRTNGNQTAVFSVTAANVTIDGFTIDGDDPGVTGGTLASGDDANVSYGVRRTGAGGNLNVSHDIIDKAAIGVRGDGASQGNVINQNSFDSIGNFDFGYAVSLRVDYYADVTNNKMTRVWTGVHINDHHTAGGPASFSISGNEIHSYAGGILYWLTYNAATGATINNNQITAQATAVANNFGLLIVTNQDAVSSTITNNTITGHNYGVGLFNVPTTNTITLGATNSITGSTKAGVFLTDNLNFNPVGTTNFLAGGPGAVSTVNVNGMSVTGNALDGIRVEGGTNLQTVTASGATITGSGPGSKGLDMLGSLARTNVSSSTITGFATGVALQGGSTTAHLNRIIASTTAIDNPGNQTANLENNWWGCNAGPGNAGCGAVTGTNADFDPWMVLGVSASPASVSPGGSSNITADMTKNSDGGAPVDTLPDMPVAWSATNGTMSPPTGTIANGQATSTFTSTNNSTGSACAMVDSQNTCANIPVVLPAFSINDVSQSEGNGGPGSTSYTFTITKIGAGAASVDYATVDGTAIAPSDYTAISATTLNFLSGDATKTITVFVNGDTAFEGDETFTVHLSNAVGATIADADGLGTIVNDDSCAAFATVYVDDSWVGTPLGSDPDGAGPATSFGCDSFATIQGGVNAVTAGGTVIVNDGSYIENVTIPKALTLTGAGAATVFLKPAVSNPNCGGGGGGSLCAGGSNLMLVQADNVTISGLTLDGDNPSLTSAENVGGANIDARNGIITNHLLATYDNLEVHHTTVKNIFLRGIYASSGGAFNFHDNTVQNVQANAGSIGMFNYAGAGAYTNNNVSACNDGISSNHSRGTTYTGNTVTTSASGIHTDNAGDSGGASDTISGNTVTNSSLNGFGIWTFVPALPVTVSNNAVTNVDVGLAAAGGVSTPVATTFTGNTVDGQNKANSTGVYLTTDQFGFGQGNNLVEFHGNTVVNNVDGFFLEAKDSSGNLPARNGAKLPLAANVSEPGYHDARTNQTSAPNVALTLTVNASFNRIVNNSNSGVTRSNNLGTLAGTFENNWWGCNAGPNNAGCGNVVGSGVDFDPWIVLGVSASPASVSPGGSSNVTADMTKNSNAATPSGGPIPPVGVSFSATNGSMSPPTGTITAGQATSTFTSSNNSTGSACAMVDNQNTCTNIPVVLPAFSIDDVSQNEGNGGPGSTSYTFTVTKTGAGAASVDYATVDGTAIAPSDYTAIPTTTLNFLSADTTKTVTVFVNGDTAFEGNETFTVHMSNAVGATIADADGLGTIVNDDTCAAFATVYVDDSWVGTALGSDPDGAGPATSFGCDSFATIQGAVTAVTAAGTVIVYDGTYTENVTITKAMTLKGNQFSVDARGRVAAESIVSPAVTTSPTFNVAFTGLITIDGFSFSGGPTGASGVIFTSVGPNNNMQISNNRFSGYPAAAIWMNRGGSDITIDKNLMDGSNLAGGGQAIFGNGPQSFAGLFITNNNVINHPGRTGLFIDGDHNVGESATRAALINGNLFNNNLQSMNLGSRSFGKQGAPLLGTYAGAISNNTFSNNSANGIQAGIQHVLVSGNTFTNNALSGLALTSFGNAALDRGAQNSSIMSNTFTNNGNGGNVNNHEALFFTASQGAGLISTNQAHFNRFVGNFQGIRYTGGETINVENNWFGCNAGPGGGGCDVASGAGLDFNPWIVLGASASPASVSPGGSSTVTADMTKNSDGATPAGGPIPQVGVSFTATNGTMSPPTGTITAGQATSTFTSTNNSTGSACAMVDNQQVCTNIPVTLPAFSIDDVSHNEGNGGPGSTSYTFTITKTGAGAASVDYATVDGTATAPSDYAAISATTLNFLSGDATKTVTVFVNGDTTAELDEAFTVHLSNAVGATISDADGTGTIVNDDCPGTFTVNNNGDAGDLTPGDGVCATGAAVCTLRAAIQEGNASLAACPININFSIPTSTITVTSELFMAHSMNINGPTAASISVAGTVGAPTRVFHTAPGQAVSISNLTVSGGRASFGAGLLAEGPSSGTTLTGMLFTGNIAIDSSGVGGGGGAASINGGALNVRNSTFSANTGTHGGGLAVQGAGPLNLVNVTVTNNSADGNTGSGPCPSGGSVDGDGGGVAGPTLPGTPINLRNTIVAGNQDCNSNNPNISPTSAFNDQGNNLTSASVDPKLELLANNGGPTFTHALKPLSPAIDAGNDCVFNNTCSPTLGVALTTDQRGPGFPRKAAGSFATAHVDIGAFEKQSPSSTSSSISGRIVDSGGNPVEGAAVRISGSQNRLTVTDSEGNYHFDEVQTGGLYTVVPTRANFSFEPAERSFSQVGEHTEAAFLGSSQATAVNPIDTTEYFVRQQYLDFLGREADEAGLSFWVNNINSCGADNACRAAKRDDTSAAFFLSIEFQQTGYLVYRVYQSAYGDMLGAPVPLKLAEFQPDTAFIGRGLIVNEPGWQAKLEANKQAFVAAFVARSRFASAYPGAMTPGEFVDRLFATAGVSPDASDRAGALAEFGSAANTADPAARARALRRVAENATLAQQESNQAFVLMQYFGYLGRDPDAAPDGNFSGYSYWLNKLDNFNGDFRRAEMVKAFLVSGEYRGRFPR